MAKAVVLTFIGETSSLDKALQQVGVKTGLLETKLAALGRFSDGMVKVGKSLSTYITLPVAGAAFAALKLGTDFDASMHKLVGLGGLPAAQIAGLEQRVLALGRAVPIGPTALADALYPLVSGGMQASAALDVLDASAKASASGLGDLPTITDLVAGAVNNYGIKNLSAADAVDELTNAVRLGKMEPAALAGAYGKVLPLAANLHVSFGEVSAALASMSHQSIDTAEGSTALRAIFTALIRPSAGVNKELKAVGLSAAGLREELANKGLLATMQTMSKATGGNVDKLAHLIPNVRGLTGYLSMMGPNGEQTVKIFKEMSGSAGATDAAFAEAGKSAKFKFALALNDLKTAGIQLGLTLLPEAEKIAGAIGRWAERFAALNPHTRTAIVQAAGLAAAVGPLVLVVGKLGKGFTAMAKHPVVTVLVLLVQAFILAYTHSAKFRAEVHHLGKELSDAVSWTDKHRAAIKALVGTIAMLGATAAVGRMAGAFTALGAGVGRIPGIAAKTGTVLARVGPLASAGMSTARLAAMNAQLAVGLLGTRARAMGATLSGAASGAGRVMKLLGGETSRVGMSLASATGNAYRFATAQTATAVSSARQTTVLAAQRAATLASAAAEKVVTAAQWLWNAAMDANPVGLVIIAVAALVAGFIYAYTHVKWFRDAMDVFGRFCREDFAKVWPYLKVQLLAFWQFFEAEVKIVFAIVQGVFRVGLDLITGKWGKAWSDAQDMFLRIWGALEGLASGAVGKVGRAIIDGVSDAGSWLVNAGTAVVDGLVSGIERKADAAVEKVKDLGSSMVSGLKGMLDIHSPSRVMATIGGHIGDGLVVGVASKHQKIRETAEKTARIMATAMAKVTIVPPLLGTAPTGARSFGTVAHLTSDLARLSRLGASPALLMQVAGAGTVQDTALTDRLLAALRSPGGAGRSPAWSAAAQPAAGTTPAGLASGQPGDVSITVNAQTNANPRDIAYSVAWALKTGAR
ncbi:hypothetical protein GCM10009760_25970 [Kitasatospora kazusensis]|uniref:Phage tail tape measure protein domain-containing protein n=1 Tax=Kitasatospora kazusensis TaxID=407974 RepID=A0ABN2ZFX8_9ACTN